MKTFSLESVWYKNRRFDFLSPLVFQVSKRKTKFYAVNNLLGIEIHADSLESIADLAGEWVHNLYIEYAFSKDEMTPEAKLLKTQLRSIIHYGQVQHNIKETKEKNWRTDLLSKVPSLPPIQPNKSEDSSPDLAG